MTRKATGKRPSGRALLLAAGVLAAVVALLLAAVPAIAQPGTTTRVSVDSFGNQGNNNSGAYPQEATRISADGRYIAFQSYATNLVPGDTNRKQDIFVHDRQTGITERESVDSSGNQGNEHSFA
ncbi:MAG: PD40 domain-containing protein, partial [Chloroflexi bacterium]|nr:PD40 domain-containing protein [Chloroflexota bacterium]